MGLTPLLDSLRAKKQTAARSIFAEYLNLVRRLASGEECDSDEVAAVLDATGRDETSLEKDVRLQEQRYSWAATMRANQLAVADRLRAERELQTAQQKLQAAFDKLQPAVNDAHNKLDDANHRFLITQGADSLLAGNLLDSELLERESSIIARLQDIVAELRPLVKDRGFKMDSLVNAEFRLAQMQARKPGDWLGFGTINPNFWKNQSIDPEQQNVADLQNQLRQMDAAIAPRQAEQARLQNELNQIHREKLLP